MINKIWFLMFLSINIYAQTLVQIQESFKNSAKVKSMRDKSFYDGYKNGFITTQDAPKVELSVARVDGSNGGGEYSLGITQNLSHPLSASLKSLSSNSLNSAIKSEFQHEFRSLSLDISSKYYQACISLEMSQRADELYMEQKSRYERVQKAYELGEISKKDLLFNKLDLAKFNQSVSQFRASYEKELQELQEDVDNLKIESLSCSDLLSLNTKIDLKSQNKHSLIEALEHKKTSANSLHALENTILPSIEYGVWYEKEVDSSRYKFGISLPLSSLTTQKEHLRAEQLSLSSSLESQKLSMQKNLKSKESTLRLKLNSFYEQYLILDRDVLPLSKELLNLSKRSLDEGEGDVIEYLDAIRSYRLNMLEMLKIRKDYFIEFFELYKNSDLDFGEII